MSQSQVLHVATSLALENDDVDPMDPWDVAKIPFKKGASLDPIFLGILVLYTTRRLTA